MQEFKQKCLVLSATTYKMTDEKTGETNSGLTLFYIPTDKLTPEDDAAARGRGQISLGIQPSKVTLPIDLQTKVKHAPALYELTLKLVTRQLKAQIQPINLEYVSLAELHPVKGKEA
ncbi:MAG: hypothetical protein FWB96_00855 [Defluviitaleaceae bacterium]|nr:hypothetical protein [Defluviitaleaceae bacterium]MCL2262757.1 hypothetical protein [Defluviitaleaceae bacterium]